MVRLRRCTLARVMDADCLIKLRELASLISGEEYQIVRHLLTGIEP